MKGFVRALVIASAAGLSASGVSAADTVDVLYDIDFAAPFHTPGLPASTDTGAIPRQGFSGYSNTASGNEPVVDGSFSLRAITGGVSYFGNSAQGVLDVEDISGTDFPIVGADYERYVLEFDAVVKEAGALIVFMDTPSINRIRFSREFNGDSTGHIYYGTVPSSPELATYSFDEFLSVRITLNKAAQTWKIEVDGETLHEGALQNAATGLRTVRFSASLGVYVDNIVLKGLNPACSTADLNGDGILDLSDIGAFIGAFQGGCE